MAHATGTERRRRAVRARPADGRAPAQVDAGARGHEGWQESSVAGDCEGEGSAPSSRGNARARLGGRVQEEVKFAAAARKGARGFSRSHSVVFRSRMIPAAQELGRVGEGRDHRNGYKGCASVRDEERRPAAGDEVDGRGGAGARSLLSVRALLGDPRLEVFQAGVDPAHLGDVGVVALGLEPVELRAEERGGGGRASVRNGTTGACGGREGERTMRPMSLMPFLASQPSTLNVCGAEMPAAARNAASAWANVSSSPARSSARRLYVLRSRRAMAASLPMSCARGEFLDVSTSGKLERKVRKGGCEPWSRRAAAACRCGASATRPRRTPCRSSSRPSSP